MTQVERVDFINIATRDAERTQAWYQDVLGLPSDAHNPRELTAGQVTLTFWEPEKEGIEFTPSIGGFAVRVPDVEAAMKDLEAKGSQKIRGGSKAGTADFSNLSIMKVLDKTSA